MWQRCIQGSIEHFGIVKNEDAHGQIIEISNLLSVLGGERKMNLVFTAR
jgi:hypothetical protein